VGSFLSVAVFWLVHVVGLLFAPTSFFTQDPRGKKALALAGVATPLAVRIVCTVLAVVFSAVIAFLVMFAIELLSRRPAG
jgi:hypothetical protein